MNGIQFGKGCKGAVWIDGKPSKQYCLNIGKANGRFRWHQNCCKWKYGGCVPKTSMHSLFMTI